MMRALRIAGFVLALAFLVMTFVNASWLAPEPRGTMKLIAHRGVHQLYDHANLGPDTCTATRIEPPSHSYLENTAASIVQAARNGASMVEVDVAPTKDGQIALFHDWTLDCRTDGHGPVRDATMAQLKTLDAGYGYSADGGRTFPFRGKGVGAIPTLAEALGAAGTKPLLYNFKSKDAHEADELAAALKAAGRDPARAGDGFYGAAGPVARIRQVYPGAWTFTKDEVTACTKAYAWQGWFGITPSACRNGTIFVPVDRAWAFAGWPNRLIARMEKVGARVVLIGPQGGKDGAPLGLDLPEQVREIPVGYNGYVWVEDIRAIGPAINPAFGKRNPGQEARFEEQMDARRKARGQ